MSQTDALETREPRRSHLAMTSFCWFPPEYWRARSRTSAGRSEREVPSSLATLIW